MPRVFPDLRLPQPELRYLRTLAATLQADLKSQLKAVFLFGSASYGAYEPGKSDLDITVIIASPLLNEKYKHLCSLITHRALPCPARKLELVIYTSKSVRNLTRFPTFETNVNTGDNLDDHVTFDQNQEAGHWFLLDLAVGRELGVALFGPDPKKVISEVPREWAIDALSESLDWWKDNEPTTPDALLNACRGWRWAQTGIWGSKLAGAKWAVDHEFRAKELVECAMKARTSGTNLDRMTVIQFLDFVKNEIDNS